MPRHVMSCHVYIYIYAYIKKSPYDVYTKSPFFLLRRIYAVQIVPWIETMNTFARPGNGRKLDVPDTVTMAGNQWTSIILPATSIFFLIHWARCKKLMCPMIFPWISHEFPMIFPWYSHATGTTYVPHDIPIKLIKLITIVGEIPQFCRVEMAL